MKVAILTPARLHLGIIDTCGDMGRLYGSIGVAIEKPSVQLEATSSLEVNATGLNTKRTVRIAKAFLEKYPKTKPVKINVLQSIPEHVGLGSGTQLSLAVGTAIARLSGLELSPQEIAAALRRGRVSGIGVSAFAYGGFILDSGRKNVSGNGTDSKVSVTVFRSNIPEEWRFVVAIPNAGKGFFGRVEREAFLTLPRASPDLVGKICRIIVMKMLPSLIERNINDFGESVTTVQNLVGESFSKVQGGRYFSPLIERTIHFLLSSGAYGAGQSSWGPTVYGIVDSVSKAETLKENLTEFLYEENGGSVFVTRANNTGAQVTLID